MDTYTALGYIAECEVARAEVRASDAVLLPHEHVLADAWVELGPRPQEFKRFAPVRLVQLIDERMQVVFDCHPNREVLHVAGSERPSRSSRSRRRVNR